MENNKEVLIRLNNLKKYFPLKSSSLFQEKQYVKANDGITLDIYKGETLGIVGESGCGKSTLGRVLLQLYKQTSGNTIYYGYKTGEFYPEYAKSTIKNLSSLKTKLAKLENKLSDLNTKLESITEEKATAKIRKELTSIQADYESEFYNVVSIVGALLLHTDLKAVSNAYSKLYTAQSNLFKLERGMTDVKSNKSDLEQAITDANHTINQLLNDVKSNALFDKYESIKDDGIDLARLNDTEMRALRKELQIIFQDPYSSLDTRLTVGQIIAEGLNAHKMFKENSKEMDDYIVDIMDKCGLSHFMIHRYPHQFSGGQRQRIGIARALALQPKFVVCDESVSALDVSIQSQVINLLKDLKEESKDLTYMFITHDLSVVKYISDRICVMYLGNIMEIGRTEDIFAGTQHPYTEALLSAIPTTDNDSKRDLIMLEGDIPSAINPPSGCKFHTRCPYAVERCKTEVPKLRDVGNGHLVACHLRGE